MSKNVRPRDYAMFAAFILLPGIILAVVVIALARVTKQNAAMRKAHPTRKSHQITVISSAIHVNNPKSIQLTLADGRVIQVESFKYGLTVWEPGAK